MEGEPELAPTARGLGIGLFVDEVVITVDVVLTTLFILLSSATVDASADVTPLPVEGEELRRPLEADRGTDIGGVPWMLSLFGFLGGGVAIPPVLVAGSFPVPVPDTVVIDSESFSRSSWTVSLLALFSGTVGGGVDDVMTRDVANGEEDEGCLDKEREGEGDCEGEDALRSRSELVWKLALSSSSVVSTVLFVVLESLRLTPENETVVANESVFEVVLVAAEITLGAACDDLALLFWE